MGTWQNQDNLFLKFGITKTTTEQAGDYITYGSNRVCEVAIPSATFTALTGSSGSSGFNTILSDTVLFPPAGSSSSGAGAANSNTWFIEKIELVGETSATTGTSAGLNVGLIQWDRSTVPSNYQFALLSGVSAALLSSGAVSTFVGTGSLPTSASGGGTFVGGSPSSATGPYYITAGTASSGATFTAGACRIRIHYRGTGTITQ